MLRPLHSSFSRGEHALKHVRISGCILVLLAFATYWNSLRVPFFFDDPIAILENPTIRNLRDLGQVLSPPRNGSGVTGRPIVNLSLAINYALGGTNVTGYHVANILFHALAGLLLLGCVHRTLLSSARLGRFRAVALPFAFCSAALWLLHPLQTESVTCVIQRTELLVGVFYLLTLYCFIRAATESSRRWSIAAVVSCGLGMASKEVMVSAPIILLLYDRTFLAGSFSGVWRARSTIHLGLAASRLVLGVLLLSVGGARGEAAGFNVGATWWSYALKQSEAVLLYLRLSIWPHPLNVFYGIELVTNPADVWLELLLVTALATGAFHAAWKRPSLGFCALWFFVILAPSSSVVPLVTQTVSEHRMYLSLAAPVVGLVAALFLCITRHAVVVSLCCAAAFALLSARRNLDYRTERVIWTDTVAKSPHNARARVNLGAALTAAGDAAGALLHYRTAVQLDPSSAEALNNLATLHLNAGRRTEAIELCRAALRLRPDFALAHNNLGTALVDSGATADGIPHLQTALRLKPTLAEAHCNLASALTAAGQVDQAIRHGEEAIRLNPGLDLAHFNLANAFLKSNQRDRAVAALQEAVRIKPTYAEAHSNLGSLYYLSGDAARAVPHYAAAVRAQPNYLEAHNNLASALFQIGRSEEAVEHYRAAIRLQPRYAEAHFNLGVVLTRMGRIVEAMVAYAEALRLRPDDERAKSELARVEATLRQSAPR